LTITIEQETNHNHKDFTQRSNIAAGASATASLACVPTWIEDFRQDVAGIDVPTLIIHGAQLVRNFIE